MVTDWFLLMLLMLVMNQLHLWLLVFTPSATIVMSKQSRTGEVLQHPPEQDRRWCWVMTPAGMWTWAFHSAYRSQQLVSQSEMAIRRGAQDAMQEGAPFTVDWDAADNSMTSAHGAHRKRKRDASP